MKTIARGWAVLALAGLAGQVQAQAVPVWVRSAPVYAVPDQRDGLADPGESELAQAGLQSPANPGSGAEAAQPRFDQAASLPSGPVEGTLNAQYAALTNAGAFGPSPAAAEPASAPGAAPSVAMAQRLVDDAGMFERYIRRASTLGADFGDGEAVARALAVGAGYDAAQLEEGEVAYVALCALQSPDFVQAIGGIGPDPATRAEIVQLLVQDPGRILRAPGASSAAAVAEAALARFGGALRTEGLSVKQYAYDVQHQPWSKEMVSDPGGRLSRIKAQSAIRMSLSSDDTGELIQSVVALRQAGPPAQATTVTPVVAHGLALAALALLGAAGDDRIDQLAPLLSDPQNAHCVQMAKLNLYQCLSAAGPHYEDAFCLGEHAMMETAACVVAASGSSELISTPAALPSPRSVQVPIALAPIALAPIALASAAEPGR